MSLCVFCAIYDKYFENKRVDTQIQPAVLSSIIRVVREKLPFGAAEILMNSMRARKKPRIYFSLPLTQSLGLPLNVYLFFAWNKYLAIAFRFERGPAYSLSLYICATVNYVHPKLSLELEVEGVSPISDVDWVLLIFRAFGVLLDPGFFSHLVPS